MRTLDDPVLRRIRIGLHFIGDDYVNPPPAHALARRHIVRNVVGYSIYGDYSKPNPPAELVHAVARGDVDVAVLWGPFAGYFGPREPVPLVLAPVHPAEDPPGLRFDPAASVRSAPRTESTRRPLALSPEAAPAAAIVRYDLESVAEPEAGDRR